MNFKNIFKIINILFLATEKKNVRHFPGVSHATLKKNDANICLFMESLQWLFNQQEKKYIGH